MAETFSDLLKRAVVTFGGKTKLANAMDISPPRLSRALGGDYPFNVENCLRLAQLTGERPSHVLRIAGKEDVAALIEQLYGVESGLSGEDADLFAFIRSLPRDGRRGLFRMVMAMREQFLHPSTEQPAAAQAPHKKRRTA